MPNSEQKLCSICLELTDVIYLPCKHHFCRECIIQSLELKSSCPVCRRITCNFINDDFALTPEGFEKPLYVYFSIPDQFIPWDSLLTISETRYIRMINHCLKTESLEFCIQQGLTKGSNPSVYGDIVKITDIKPWSVGDLHLYQVRIEFVRRVRIESFSLHFQSDINEVIQCDTLYHQNIVSCITKEISDHCDEECSSIGIQIRNLLDTLLGKINDYDKLLILPLLQSYPKQTNEKDLELFSLKMVQVLTTNYENLIKIYYECSLRERLRVIHSHISQFLIAYSF